MVHPVALRASYHTILRTIPSLFTEIYTNPKPDIILHVGLAAGRRCFAIEKGARGDVYTKSNDVDGFVFSKDKLKGLFGDIWDGFNGGKEGFLETGLDWDDILCRWREYSGIGANIMAEQEESDEMVRNNNDSRIETNENLEEAEPRLEKSSGSNNDEVFLPNSQVRETISDETSEHTSKEISSRIAKNCQPLPIPLDLRVSPDAGNYVCGFLYYNTMAHFFRQKASSCPVAFCHVPYIADDDPDIEIGAGILKSLIRALVDSWCEKGASGNMWKEHGHKV
jgi:pyrrolidone-carboxylate peptidase